MSRGGLISRLLRSLAGLVRTAANILDRAAGPPQPASPSGALLALAERFPGAPEHWLRMIAERAPHLADAPIPTDPPARAEAPDPAFPAPRRPARSVAPYREPLRSQAGAAPRLRWPLRLDPPPIPRARPAPDRVEEFASGQAEDQEGPPQAKASPSPAPRPSPWRARPRISFSAPNPARPIGGTPTEPARDAARPIGSPPAHLPSETRFAPPAAAARPTARKPDAPNTAGFEPRADSAKGGERRTFDPPTDLPSGERLQWVGLDAAARQAPPITWHEPHAPAEPRAWQTDAPLRQTQPRRFAPPVDATPERAPAPPADQSPPTRLSDHQPTAQPPAFGRRQDPRWPALPPAGDGETVEAPSIDTARHLREQEVGGWSG